MSKFKKGDTVVCVDAGGQEAYVSRVNKGQMYQVLTHYPYQGGEGSLILEGLGSILWRAGRFLPLKSAKPSTPPNMDRVIQSEQIIYVDVDDTILMWGKEPYGQDSSDYVTFHDPYENKVKHVSVNKPILKVVRDRLKRGATIIIHSASGWQWAVAARAAVGLADNPNVYCQSKPIGFMDDKPCEKWMGDHIYLTPDDPYGHTNK